MIHRYLFDILTSGIAAIKADPSTIDELFQENYVLVSEEADAIKQYFLSHDFKVYNGYPRTTSEFPSIHIILADEAEVESVLGDSGGIIKDETDPNYQAEIITDIWEHKYRLMIVSEHPDVTAYYYEIIKFIMLEGFDYLTEDGCFEFKLSGMELAPDPKYLPEYLFVRQMVFECQREFQRINKRAKWERIRSVSGIHVDKAGSLSEVGDVKTNVKPYTE